jgi:hypothetical protein
MTTKGANKAKRQQTTKGAKKNEKPTDEKRR